MGPVHVYRTALPTLVLAVVAVTATLSPAAFGATGSDHVSATSRSGPAPIYDAETDTFSDAPAPERGWQGLANLLEYVTPKVNTAIPLSASQITDRISAMLDAGQNEAALDIIRLRQAQLKDSQQVGTDVQLMFLHARALNALGRHEEASAIWSEMTTTYPELPEPWNNLAVEYVRRGQLDRAREALEMALVSDPDFAPALANLGQVQMKLAEQTLQKAQGARGGQPPATVANPAQ